MASDARTDGETRDAGSRSALDRFGITHRHTAGTTAIAVAFALVCGLYASWLLADFGLRWLALVVALGGGALFYTCSTRAGVFAAGCYGLAVLVALTPVMLDLAFVAVAGGYGITSPWPFVLSLADLVFVAVFVVLALVLAGIGVVVGRRG